MNPEFCFVQFLHPGPEERPEGDQYGWNRKDVHRRRFIRQRGDYLDGENIRHRNVDLTFWGEWEAEGDAERILPDGRERERNHPNYYCAPWYKPRPRSEQNRGGCEPDKDGKRCQNTDPFVLGDRFFYSNCRQRIGQRNIPTQLQSLESGSIILFGSRINEQFCLDTVFVVEDSHPYRALADRERIEGLTSPAFMAVTGDLVGDGQDFTLHRGKMYDPESPDTPFSFVPCLPYDDGRGRFARPVIDLGEYIQPKQRQGYKLNRGIHPEKAQELWRNVRKQVVEESELGLGVAFDSPPLKS